MTKKKETFEHLHGKPVTRRDFLSTGLLSFSATMFMPSMFNILARSGVAQAEELVCKAGTVVELCPFIGLKLSGGAALSANMIPHDKGGQLLPSYTKMGLGLGGSFGIDREFANQAPFYNGSQILAGIRSAATPTTLAMSNFIGVCVRSQDDSSMNKFDITGLIGKSGVNGKILPNLGRTGTDVGVNNLAAFLKPAAPLIVSRYEDVVGSLGVSGSLASLSSAQKSNLFGTIQNLTASQAQKIQGMTGGDVLSRLIQCANIDNTNLISNTTSLNIDPLSNAAFAQVWNINAATNKGSQDFVFATMVYNALNGNAGTVNLEIGGFDYHNGTRTSGDTKDLEAGTVIGKILQSMAILGKKAFIIVTSDGSVTSAESNTPGAPWMSDRGVAGMAYMVTYDPVGPHATKSFQLGHYVDGQAADDTFLTGGSAELAAGGMFANYLSFNGKSGLFESLLPRVLTDPEKDLVTIIA